MALAAGAAAQVTLTEGTNLSADVSPDGERVAMDLLGSVWVVSARGGAADKIVNNFQPARDPRWSPDGSSILYQTRSALGSRLWVRDLAAGTSRRVSEGDYFDHQADWHPDGRRIVFSSQRDDTGFDLWESHLPSGVSWRLTRDPGDETWPAWSADGRDLAYVRELDGEWRLMLRRHARPERTLVVSDEKLAAPSWRPDGSLLTYLQQQGDALTLQMIILSEPPVVRTLARGEDFFLAPVSWRDRLFFYYTANGVIRERRFNDWQPRTLGFRATVGRPPARPPAAAKPRGIELDGASGQRLVIRTRRLLDGETAGYREGLDVVIEDGRIAALRPRGAPTEGTVLDLGDATLLPGFIDVYAHLDDAAPSAGRRLLAWGITTLVADDAPEGLAESWNDPGHPGPRLLRAVPVGGADDDGDLPALVTLPAAGVPPDEHDPVAAWQSRGVPVLAESWSVGLRVGADLLLGAEELPASPLGRRYADLAVASGGGPVTLVSGLADAGTPGIDALFDSRQAGLTPIDRDDVRRYAGGAVLDGDASTVVVGSKPNGLPAGMALHAELRALSAAGLDGGRVLAAAGHNAAEALGYGRELGRVAPGAVADLVIVAGDPLADPARALNIVAVIRNGRFYSLVRLLEEARTGSGVE